VCTGGGACAVCVCSGRVSISLDIHAPAQAWEDKWAAREQALREGFEAKLTAATATAATAAAPPASASLSAVQQVPVSVGGAVAGAGDDLAEIRAEETAALRLDIQTLASSLHEALLRNQGVCVCVCVCVRRNACRDTCVRASM
jgi:hypothetical protein